MSDKLSKRPTVIPCSVFGGRSPKTGKRVGERHRWSGGEWGKGTCEFCRRTLSEVLDRSKSRPDAGSAAHLERALETGD